MTFYTNVLRYLYTFGYYLAIPVLLVRLIWRSMRYHSGYSQRWHERFGFINSLPSLPTVWVHAVSLGETLAAVPLIKNLLQRFPSYQVVVTSTTPTGAAQVAKHFTERVIGVYTPYDLPDSVSRFLQRTRPSLGIIMETELWPNLLAACSRRKIPLLLANARLSPRSAHGYYKIRPLAHAMLNSFALVAAQSLGDAERFLALGLNRSKLQVMGNIKFDIALPPDLKERGKVLRQQWGSERPVWVAASTHEGEETILLEAFHQIREALPDALLVLVPRHPERFAKVKQICQQAGFNTVSRAKAEPVTAESAILLGDTMGELLLFYAAVDVAFVGGSLVNVGGHNLIEPAILELPVLTGPVLHNFVDISQLLIKAGAAKVVCDAQEIAAMVVELLTQVDQRQQMGKKGREAVLANVGALEKHLRWIEDNIPISFDCTN